MGIVRRHVSVQQGFAFPASFVSSAKHPSSCKSQQHSISFLVRTLLWGAMSACASQSCVRLCPGATCFRTSAKLSSAPTKTRSLRGRRKRPKINNQADAQQHSGFAAGRLALGLPAGIQPDRGAPDFPTRGRGQSPRSGACLCRLGLPRGPTSSSSAAPPGRGGPAAHPWCEHFPLPGASARSACPHRAPAGRQPEPGGHSLQRRMRGVRLHSSGCSCLPAKRAGHQRILVTFLSCYGWNSRLCLESGGSRLGGFTTLSWSSQTASCSESRIPGWSVRLAQDHLSAEGISINFDPPRALRTQLQNS